MQSTFARQNSSAICSQLAEEGMELRPFLSTTQKGGAPTDRQHHRARPRRLPKYNLLVMFVAKHFVFQLVVHLPDSMLPSKVTIQVYRSSRRPCLQLAETLLSLLRFCACLGMGQLLSSSRLNGHPSRLKQTPTFEHQMAQGLRNSQKSSSTTSAWLTLDCMVGQARLVKPCVSERQQEALKCC